MKLNFSVRQMIFGLAFVLILAATLIGLALNLQSVSVINQKDKSAKEAERPAELSITALVDSNCLECNSLKPWIDAIKTKNVKITSEKTVEISSQEGKDLIAKFQIAKIPSLIISGELIKDQEVSQLWQNLGEIIDNQFVLRQTGAPYLDLAANEIKGLVKITLLTDKNCADCYDVTRHLAILSQLGIPIVNRQILDSSDNDGKKLIRDYQIKLLPTLILEGDLAVYPTLKNIWTQVGTIESNGAYVFRTGVTQMGVYRDLSSGKIVNPQPATNQINTQSNQ